MPGGKKLKLSMRKETDAKSQSQQPELDNLIEKTKQEIEALKVMISILDDFNGRQIEMMPVHKKADGNQDKIGKIYKNPNNNNSSTHFDIK